MSAGTNIARESNFLSDVFKGRVPDLINAGIIEPKHLVPQPGRLAGITMFLPDGQPVPPGWAAPTGVPGYLSIRVLRSGTCIVRKTIAADERQRRIDAQPPYVSGDRRRFRGTMEKLLKVGVLAHWMAGLPAPGKTRGRRLFRDGDEWVEVNVGQRGEFSIYVVPFEQHQRSEAVYRNAREHRLAAEGSRHNHRKLPAGWRVIEGQRPA